MTTTVRRAREKDRPELARLVAEWAASEGAPAETGFLERCAATLDLRLAGVAEVDDELVGFARAVRVDPLPWPGAAPWGHLDALYVQPTHRGGGLGRALLRHLAEVAGADGLRLVRVTSSDEARPVYEAAGFVGQPRAMVLRLDQGEV